MISSVPVVHSSPRGLYMLGMLACFSSEPTFGPSSIFEYLRKSSMDIYRNIAYGMVVNMLLWNDSNIPYYSNKRCFNCKILKIFTLLKISISVSVLLQKLSMLKTWMLLGPRYSRMGGGTCVAYFKGQAFVKQGCE
jgi:hypothetical protein